MPVSVQLKGESQVMEAFDNVGVNVWAIFQAKNLLTKGDGADALQQFLTMITKNSSTQVYTLKLYEDITDPKQVKEKTEASTTLNFRLTDEDFNAVGATGYGNSSIKMLEAKLDKILEERELADQPQTLEEAAIGLIGNPGQLAQVIYALKDLGSLFFGGGNKQTNNPAGHPYTGPAVVGNLQQAEKMTEQENLELQRLQSAIDILLQKDPQLVEHLEKLAIMAQDNPGQFKMLLGMLEKF